MKTQIQISTNLRNSLRGLKIARLETYDEIITRLVRQAKKEATYRR